MCQFERSFQQHRAEEADFGIEEEAGGGGTSESVADGGAISHYASDDVEFDEDRNHSR